MLYICLLYFVWADQRVQQCYQGRIQDFVRGGAKHISGSLKQGVWGLCLSEAIGSFIFKVQKFAKCKLAINIHSYVHT